MRLAKTVSLFQLIFFFLVLTPCFGAFDSADLNNSTEQLKINRITPSGDDVQQSRQIVITFNRPVVPVGRMERDPSEIPVTITPALECEWRWLNTSSLACQLGEKTAMNLATRYTMTIRPGIKAEDGSTIVDVVTHTFTTQRPKVTTTWFKTWKSPGMPYITAYFDQPVTESSVEKHIYLSAGLLARVRLPLEAEEDPNLKKRSDYEKGKVWILSPREELGPDKGVTLWVEPGLVSTKGPEPGAEDRNIVSFHTFPEFRFLGVTCTGNNRRQLKISPADNDTKKCNPLYRTYLEFSSPVTKEAVKDNLSVTPDLAGGRTDYDPWANVYSYSRLSRPHQRGNTYNIPLPEVLKAFEKYSLKADGSRIRDEFNRPLAQDIDMEFMTDHRVPDFHLKSQFPVLEKGVDTDMTMVVTNLESIDIDYETITSAGTTTGRKKEIRLEKVEDVAYRTPLGTRDMLGAPSGVVTGKFDTSPSTMDSSPTNRWFFSQVTPYNVHVKMGHHNSLVWVTDLATGKPVPGVEVEVYRDAFTGLPSTEKVLKEIKDRGIVLTSGVTGPDGTAVLDGTVKVDPELSHLRSGYWNWSHRAQLFVRCKKGTDMAIVPLIYNFKNDPQGTGGGYISNWLKERYGHIHTWGTTAQGVYKAGDTIQYKIYVRDQNNDRFVSAPDGPYDLKVIDPMDKVVHEVKDITLSSFGAHDGEFIVPKTGAVGWYRFELSAKFTNDSWVPMRVLVSDFTPSPFRVTTDIEGALFKSGDTVRVGTSARLHSGGPYTNAGTRITARLMARGIVTADPRAKGFTFDVSRYSGTTTVHQSEGFLDDKGNLATKFTLGDSPVLYGRLVIEGAVRDDRGKYVAGSSSVVYVGRDRYVGIRQPDWVLHEDKKAVVETVVIDEHGKLAEGTKVDLKVEYRKTTASRVKGAGNAYLTKYTHEWVDVKDCALVSASSPVACTFTPEAPGSYRMTAKITDTKGLVHSSTLRRWAVGKGVVLWDTEREEALQIFPEKTEINVGEKARYLVQNPYPGARALITVERYGVIDSWVETFENSTEIVEFDVSPNHLPGFYLSVVVFSPRVDKPVVDGTVDLGKPAFRMGYVRVPVVDGHKMIDVEVMAEKDVYKPRDKVRVKLKTRLHSSGKAPGEPVELAVAVLDESVFDLLAAGRSYFDPYRGFYYLDSLDLANFNLLKQLVGRMKLMKKGANPGGDGGMDLDLRSLFKFVSYWNPSLATDRKGRAEVEFDLPDNLTGWKVLVMAVTPGDRMGLGDTTFKVNRPTEIRPTLPNQVTEGDIFDAGFTVMNRTDEPRSLEVAIEAQGPVEGRTRSVQTLKAEPYKRYTLRMPVKTTGDGEITFTVRAGDQLDKDALKSTLAVRKRASLEAAATYGTTTRNEVSETIAFPENIRTDVGKVSVVASPTVIGNVEGAFEYMRDYPYMCWEQKLTKGVMASHYNNLRAYLPDELKWEKSRDLPAETLALAQEHQAPNGGMTYYRPENRYVSPYLSAYTAIAFNWLEDSGHEVPGQVRDNLHNYLLELLRRDVMPGFYTKGMSSSVRAVALAALAPHGKVTADDVRRYRRHVPEMSLFGKAHYLQALVSLSADMALQKAVVDDILSHSNQTGGKFILSEAIDAGYERILATPLRDNCASLSALTIYSEETPGGGSHVGDIPFKLVRTITQTRGNRTRWENTQENMFCMNALTDYSRIYEKDVPDMTVKARLGNENMGSARFTGFTDAAAEFDRPIREGDPGRTAKVKIEREGTGRVYYSTRLFYAPAALRTDPVNSGIDVRREYSVERDGKWVLLGKEMDIKAGEIVRVDLFLSLPSARNFVVVEDPVPGGLEPVNRDLATSSAVDADKGAHKYSGGSFWFTRDDWLEFGFSRWSFYHKELRHHAARFYSEYLPAGNYHLSYVAQAIAPGTFSVMPLKAEEMYDPDVFGKGVPAVLKVGGND